ncbi:DedA family protein [Picrophilus oshimae]|uniref:Alkaline phosphatase like protein n=1 Tax=Picrophilus torridus (strain ATCC 700027 / DSM 9790 / JCM 10055 / NBRC 100828 / KAW 2/3) TaxID=1122961 RepID=Q6KZX1_PICTO|nr:DedA family protein [Picrophilus oshimae]AAT43731.1 alkaline phosphatase like protein [Picrophilus oshimae DSM 9789]
MSIGSIIIAIIHFVEYIIIKLGYPGVFFLMLLEGMLLPVPSEVVMPFSGYLAYYGMLDPFNRYASIIILLIVGTVGNLTGALIAYAIGKYGGDPFIIKYGRYLMLNRDTIDRSKIWFEKYGKLSVFTTRFLPVFRTFISIPAGIANMDLGQFSLYTIAGDLVWDSILIYLGILLGSRWETILGFFNNLTYIAIIAFIAAIIIVYYYLAIKPRKTLNK